MVSQATDIFCQANGISGADIATWNDAPERTRSDVLQAFTQAIELAGKSE